MQQGKRDVSAWSVLRCYKQGKRSVESSFVRRWSAGNDVSAAVEEPPLLEAVARKLVVKTLRAGKDLT
jgi:hypothetical protein